jgi:hypothetical protein
MSHISDVIGWKFNHQQGMSTVDGIITEFPGGVPSQSDQDIWTAEYEAHLAATEYKVKRKDEYPSFEDQFDELYHNGIDGWKSKIKAIKDKYPKP